MLQATQFILQAKPKENISPYLEVVSKHGCIEDSRLLYSLFLDNKNPELLGPVWLHGDAALADDLFKKAVQNGDLHPDFPPEIFYALSYLEHPETEHILFNYYKQLFDGDMGWDLHTIVCLSLLNYTCAAYKTVIETEIEKCFAVHLFPEFIPVLACKTGNTALADSLYEHGCTKASSDASAGLILGTALYGQKYRERFKSIFLFLL